MAAAYPKRISNIIAGLMLTGALIFDGLQFLLTLTVFGSIISPLVTFFALCIFGFWFLLHGINYIGGRKAGIKLASTIGAAIAEMVPFINGLPAITAGVLGVIYASRAEDKESAEASRRAAIRAEKEDQARQARLYQARMRAAEVRTTSASRRAANDNEEEEYQAAA